MSIVGMHALPLAGIHGKTLNDDQVILEQILARNVWIIKVVVLHVLPGGRRWRLRGDRLESHPDYLDRRGTGVGAAIIGRIAGVLPHHPALAPQGRPSARAG